MPKIDMLSELGVGPNAEWTLHSLVETIESAFVRARCMCAVSHDDPFYMGQLDALKKIMELWKIDTARLLCRATSIIRESKRKALIDKVPFMQVIEDFLQE